jgi:hypothetical protein
MGTEKKKMGLTVLRVPAVIILGLLLMLLIGFLALRSG